VILRPAGILGRWELDESIGRGLKRFRAWRAAETDEVAAFATASSGAGSVDGSSETGNAGRIARRAGGTDSGSDSTPVGTGGSAERAEPSTRSRADLSGPEQSESHEGGDR
jgi:hypothetical protein